MLEINDKDMEYAAGEIERLKKTKKQTRMAWEKELIENSRAFWDFLIKESVEASRAKGKDPEEDNFEEVTTEEGVKEFDNLREVYTLVFAAVYSACGESLPQLSLDEILALLDIHEDALEKEILEEMEEMNPGWTRVFKKTINEKYDFHHSSRRVLFWVIKTLLNELSGDRERDKRESVKSKWPNGHPGVSSIRDMDEDQIKIEPVSTTGITFDQIGGLEEAKKKIMRLSAALNKPERYKHWGTDPPRGVCLVGPPGCGKTLLARALAEETQVPFYYINPAKMESMWYSKSEQHYDEMFDKACQTDGIIFVDEADTVVSSRQNLHTHEATMRVVSTFNRRMDGFEPSDRVVVIFATNNIKGMDPAILRAGRISLIIEVPMPDRGGRKQIFKVRMKEHEKMAGRKLFSKRLDLDLLSEKTDQRSGADIAEILRRALEEKVIEEDTGGKPGLVTTKNVLVEIDRYERRKEKGKPPMGLLRPKGAE